MHHGIYEIPPLDSGYIRGIINCYAADQRFCEYDYREKVAMYVFWNYYRVEGSVSERLQPGVYRNRRSVQY